MGDIYRLPGTEVMTTHGASPILWRRGAAWLTLLGPLFFLSYGACNWFTGLRSDVGVVVFGWEKHLPFVPQLMLPYMSIDLFYAASLFLFRDSVRLDRHAQRLLLATLISCAGFLLFPLRFSFDVPHATGFNGWLQSILLGFDKPYNQAPSLHISLLIILWVAYDMRLAGLWRIVLHGWFALISLSVVLVYQHHFIDLVTGAIAGGVCLYALPEPAHRWRWHAPTEGMRRIGGRYAIAAGVCLLLALLIASRWSAWGWLLLWPTLSLGLVSAAYYGLGNAVFQRTNGRIGWPASVVLGPYLFGVWLSYRRYLKTLPPLTAVSDNIWLGAYPNETKTWHGVLDLTNEFIAPGKGQANTRIFLPVLDLTAPSQQVLVEAVRWLDEQFPRGPTLVHCALGLSRSACVIATWMAWSKRVADTESAFIQLNKLRPGITWTNEHLAQAALALQALGSYADKR